MEKKEAIISLGSNRHDRKKRVEEIIGIFKMMYNDVVCSDIYQTPDVRGRERMYANAVLKFSTDFSISDLKQRAWMMEKQFGRTTDGVDVPIDIDIVMYDGEILREKDYQRDYFQIGYRQIASLQSETK